MPLTRYVRSAQPQCQELSNKLSNLSAMISPGSDDGARSAALAALAPGAVAKLGECDQAFFAYPDDLTALLYKYVSEHREEINVPSEF